MMNGRYLLFIYGEIGDLGILLCDGGFYSLLEVVVGEIC
jgi:hypothetical protein